MKRIQLAAVIAAVLMAGMLTLAQTNKPVPFSVSETEVTVITIEDGVVTVAPVDPEEDEPDAAAKLSRLDELAQAEVRRREARALVAKLRSAEPEELVELERQLLDIGADAMIPLKLAELANNYELRRRAEGIAARLRWHLVTPSDLRAQFPEVIDTMAEASAEDRDAMVDAVAEWAKPAAVDFFAECLTDPQVYVRQRAVDGLVAIIEGASYGDERETLKPRITAVLTELLDDPDRDVRLLAVGAMMQAEIANVPRVGEMLQDESMEVRATALKALGFSRDQAAMKYVLPLLDDPQWRVRAAALEAVKQLARSEGREQLHDYIIARLADPEPFVREKAVALLGRWGVKGASELLLARALSGEISEGAGFKALVQLKSVSAREELIRLYGDASSPHRKGELLGYLNGYYQDTAVDEMFGEALADESMRPVWPVLMSQALRRREWEALYAVVTERLLDADAEIAQGAWNAVSYRCDEKPLPAKVLQGLLKSDDPMRVGWALLAVYSGNASDAAETYLAVLQHSSQEVVTQAVGFIAGELLEGDRLHVDAPYRRSRYPGSGAVQGVSPYRDKMIESVRSLVSHEAQGVHLRAAAILYRTDADRGDDVQRIIRAGLVAAPEMQSIALGGIQDAPDMFEQDMDLPTMARHQITADRAIRVIAALADDRYVPLLLELAEANPSQLVLAMLVRSGQEQAIQAAMAKLNELDSYRLREFAQAHLKDMKGPGPVRVVKWVFTEKRDTLGYYADAWVVVLISLDDPSSKAVLLDVLDNGKSWMDEWRYRQVRPQMLIRLAELDPDLFAERIQAELTSGDHQSRYEMIGSILTVEPTEVITDAVYDIAVGAAQAGDNIRWFEVASWLSDEAMRGKFMPSLGRLPKSLRAGLLRRATIEFTPADLPVLLAIEGIESDWKLRATLGGLTAALTSEDPASRPDLTSVSDDALPFVLVAAGDWADAREVLGPLLNDARPPVAAAARLGLAYFVVGHPDIELSPDEQQALVAAASVSDGVGAYLAAEALDIADPEVLLSLDPLTLSGSPAIARGLLARAGELSDDEHAQLNKYLQGQYGATTVRLAIAAAVRAGPEGLSPNIARLAYTGSVNDRRLARLVASGSDPADVLALPARSLLSAEAVRTLQPLADILVAQASQEEGELLMNMIHRGWYTTPQPGDFDRIVRSAKFLTTPNDWPGSAVFAARSMRLAISEAPDEPTPDMLKRMNYRTREGLLIAATAWIRWDNADGREAIVRAIKLRDQTDMRQQLALTALKMGGDDASADLLVAYGQTLDGDDWEDRSTMIELVGILMASDPARAGELLWDEEGALRDDSNRYRLSSVIANLLVALADDAGPKPEIDGRYGAVDHTWRLLLARARDEELADGEASAVTPLLLPPWGAGTEEELIGFRLKIVSITESPPDEAVVADLRPSQQPEDYYMLTPGYKRENNAQFAGEMSEEDTADLRDELLAGELVWRIWALRNAVDLQAHSLGDDIAGLLGEEELVIEAAWSLAMLRGTDAIGPIEAAYNQQTDFSTRVRLACLLRLLGSDAGQAAVDRAVELWTTRRFRLIFTEGVLRGMISYQYGGYGYVRGPDPLATRLVPWRAALEHAAGDLLAEAEAKFTLPGGDNREPSDASIERNARYYQGMLPLTALRLSLQVDDITSHGLPIRPLVMLGGERQTFASQCETEQHLEPYLLVQFADRSGNFLAMDDQWQQWWEANGEKSRDQWWRQAVGQAAEELTHERWWHRCRALRRLERLTGRVVASPALFDMDGWRALQLQWNAWRQANEGDTQNACLIREGMAAGLLSESALLELGSAEAVRGHLVKLAGWGSGPLAEAALLRLETLDCSDDELLRSALVWQECPKLALAHWVRSQAAAVTGRQLLRYTADDLPAAAPPAPEPTDPGEAGEPVEPASPPEPVMAQPE